MNVHHGVDDAKIVELREHIARLWRIIARDVVEAAPDLRSKTPYGEPIDWDSVLTPLQIAASLDTISADTWFVDDTMSVVLCKPVAEYEDRHSQFVSSYLRRIVVFSWAWSAFECVTDLTAGERRRKSAVVTEHFIAYVSAAMRYWPRMGIPRSLETACRFLGKAEAEQAFRKSCNNCDDLYSIRLCQQFRNKIMHGKLAIPGDTLFDFEEEFPVPAKCYTDHMNEVVRLVLFAIQLALIVKFADSERCTGEVMASDGVPEDVSISRALSCLHLAEPGILEGQLELFANLRDGIRS